MPEQDKDIYGSIEAKFRVIVDRQNMLVNEIKSTRAENSRLQAQVSNLKAEIERLKLDNKYLTVSSTVAPTREDTEVTGALLSELVREIDRCIAEISNS
jgi:FtsZ-binding cell division protein ZapB